MRKILQYHPNKCMGCHSCELACSFKHEKEFNPQFARIFIEIDGSFHIPLTCSQCENPWCASICPKNAISRNLETGAMEVDQKLCVGCRMCTMACPFGLIVMGPRKKAIKCNLCSGDPECVKACTYGALEFTIEETRILERRNIIFQYLKKSFFCLESPPKSLTLPEVKHE
jgi:carbon-monoxide dehydrogenase iron sulfur subunit